VLQMEMEMEMKKVEQMEMEIRLLDGENEQSSEAAKEAEMAKVQCDAELLKLEKEKAEKEKAEKEAADKKEYYLGTKWTDSKSGIPGDQVPSVSCSKSGKYIKLGGGSADAHECCVAAQAQSVSAPPRAWTSTQPALNMQAAEGRGEAPPYDVAGPFCPTTGVPTWSDVRFLPGCWMFSGRLYYNAHPTGSSADARLTPVCKA